MFPGRNVAEVLMFLKGNAALARVSGNVRRTAKTGRSVDLMFLELLPEYLSADTEPVRRFDLSAAGHLERFLDLHSLEALEARVKGELFGNAGRLPVCSGDLIR